MENLGESRLARVWHKAFPSFFPSFSVPGLMYHHIIAPTENLVDAGCGSGSLLVALKKIGTAEKLKGSYCIGLDVSLERIRSAKRVYDDVIQCDIRYIPIRERAADITLCHHVIEHLDKRDGRKLLRDLNLISSKLIMIAMPVGWVAHKHSDEDTWQFHRSGWMPDELKKLKFQVFGTDGPKTLYGRHRSRIWRFPPMYMIITTLTHLLITRRRPDLATQMICVKRIC